MSESQVVFESKIKSTKAIKVWFVITYKEKKVLVPDKVFAMFQLHVWGFVFGFVGDFGWSFMGKKRKDKNKNKVAKEIRMNRTTKIGKSIDMNDYD